MSQPTHDDDGDRTDQYRRHVRMITRIIADDLDTLASVSEAQAGDGVIHLFTEPRYHLGAEVFEAVAEHGAQVRRVDVRNGGSSVEQLHARITVSDERLREGWSA